MTTRDPQASLNVAISIGQSIGRGITIGRAQVFDAFRRIIDLTSRPVCGAVRPDVAQVLALVEHVIAKDWDIDKIIAREEHREPSGDVGGGWVWAVYRDDDTMMTELHRRAARSPA